MRERWGALGCRGDELGTAGNQGHRSPPFVGGLQVLRLGYGNTVWRKILAGLAVGRSGFSLSAFSYPRAGYLPSRSVAQEPLNLMDMILK